MSTNIRNGKLRHLHTMNQIFVKQERGDDTSKVSDRSRKKVGVEIEDLSEGVSSDKPVVKIKPDRKYSDNLTAGNLKIQMLKTDNSPDIRKIDSKIEFAGETQV